MILRLIPIVLLATACATTPPAATPVPAETVAIDPATLPRLPWHMTNLWWTVPPVRDFHSFAIDVEIVGDIPSDRYNLYISPLNGQINGITVYGGIQTNCNGWSARNPADHTRLHGGPGFIFSRWGAASELSLNDIRANPGGFVETAGYEGNFASGRCPYPWKAGKYTFSILRLDSAVVDGKAYTWFGCFVREHRTDQTVFVTALRFPGDSFVHAGKNGGFLEFYGTEKIREKPDIPSLPPLSVTFSNLRFNGVAADLQKIQVHFLRHDEQRKDKLRTPVSPNLLHVSATPDGQAVTCRLVNRPFPDAEEPNRMLWEKKDEGEIKKLRLFCRIRG